MGKGVFATQNIEKGSFVCQYIGDIITLDEDLEREEKYGREGKGCYSFEFNWNGLKWCIDATKENNTFGRMINHGKKCANLKPKLGNLPGCDHPVLYFVALRDIKVGEQLFYDYKYQNKAVLEDFPWLRV